MAKRIDLTGQRFGAWKVIEYVGQNALGQPSWTCRCACGTVRNVVGQTLRTGTSKSCGCEKPGAIARAKTTHGQSRGKNHPESEMYVLWQGMLARCKRSPYYKDRIEVCDRWKDFTNFLKDMGERAPAASFKDLLTIERRDNDRGYEPDNCYWATWTQQNRNKRKKA
jgi:hypothetical protein